MFRALQKAGLLETAENLVNAGWALGTRRRYESALKHWRAFAELFQLAVTDIAVPHLEAYIAHRFRSSACSAASLALELTSIRALALQRGALFPQEAQLARVRAMCKGVRRSQSTDLKAKRALPISALRRGIHSRHSRQHWPGSEAILEVALLTVAFGAMLRVSEYTAPKTTGRSALLRNQLSASPNWSTPRTISIAHRHSKTNQLGRPESSVLSCVCPDITCPVHALLAHLAGQNQAPGDAPVFQWRNGSPVNASQMRALVKRIAQESGLNAASFSSHSLRSGGATALFASGIPLNIVERLGRWSAGSTALRHRYIQASQASVAQLAAKPLRASTI